ncbi:uncharacterized protein V1477_005152 [Vespula maculifrons]|uniref:Uncharacterized protein n=1 Tax=Vespula maculifrons TaxID=7453 RepID=A0ABD2CNY3_VESMC
MQQPPRGGTWVGSTCDISETRRQQVLPSEWLLSLGWDPWVGLMGVGFCAGFLSVPKNPAPFSYSDFSRIRANTGRIERTLARVSADANVVFSGAIKSPTSHSDIHVSVRARLKVLPGTSFYVRRLFAHDGLANLRVESPLTRGSPDAATSTRWDLGRRNLEIFTGFHGASINDKLKFRTGDTLLRQMTTKSNLCPTFRVTGPVVLWTSTGELNNFRRCHLCKLKCDVGLLVQLCVGLRPVNLEIFTDDIRVRINEQLIQIYNSLFDFRLKCHVGLLVQLCVGLRPVNLEIFTDDIRVRINEQLIQIYNSLFDFRLKCDVGLLVQLCVELRRVNLEIFTPLRNFENLSPRVDLEIFEHLRDFENLSPRVDLEIFTPLRNFENLSPRVDLEIFEHLRDFENLSPRVDLEIFTPLRNFENLSPRVDLEIFEHLRDFENLSPRVDLEIFTPLRNFENLSPRVDLEIFEHLRDFENLSPRVDLEIFAPLVDFENLSPRVDLEIFEHLRDFENLSPPVDLEIFIPLVDFENLSPRVDLEIFSENSCKLRAMQFLESVFVRKVICFFNSRTDCTYKRSRPTSMSTYLMFNQLQIVHPQFRPKSRSSVLEPSQNFLSGHEAKKRLCAEEAPTNCGSRGQLLGYRVIFEGRIPNRIPDYPALGDSGTDHRGIFTRKLKEPLCIHDRSCLDMSEADGVDSGAICKRGFIHLQFAEKPEAPEAERHLGSRILE